MSDTKDWMVGNPRASMDLNTTNGAVFQNHPKQPTMKTKPRADHTSTFTGNPKDQVIRQSSKLDSVFGRFGKNNLVKFGIFIANFRFLPNISILAKIWICAENLDCCRKFGFWPKISIFDENFNLCRKF